jgi:hypothetical protein
MYSYAQRTTKVQNVRSDTTPGAPHREHSHAAVNCSGNKNYDDSVKEVVDEKAGRQLAASGVAARRVWSEV